MSNIPALPDGFTLDAQDEAPALPDGFALDAPESVPALPDGFSLDGAPDVADVNPEGTAVGRALKRGVLRTRSTLPAIQAQKGATVLSDAALSEGDLIRQAFLETTRLPDVPEGVDISTPELASAAIAGLGYPAQFANTFRQTYDIRARDAAAAVGNEGEVLQTAIGNIQEAQGLNDRAAVLPGSPNAEAFKQVLSEAPDTLLDVLKVYAQNPGTALAFLGETAAESLPQMGASAATTLATRSPAAGALVLGGGTVAQEFGSSVNEFFAEQGVSPKTPEEAEALIRDPAFMAEASRRGLGRGVVIALAEMAGQGVAAQQLFKGAVKEAGKDVTAQMATGAGGEAAARAATGQEMSAREIVTEALAEGVAAPVEVGATVYQSRQNAKADQQPPETPEDSRTPAEALAVGIDAAVDRTEAAPDAAAPVTDEANTTVVEQPATPELPEGFTLDAAPDAAAQPEVTGNPAIPEASSLETTPTDVETPSADVDVTQNVTEPELSVTEPELDVAEGVVRPYDGEAAGRDPEYHARREQAVTQAVDDTLQRLEAESTLTVGQRREIIEDLNQNGGPVENAVTGYFEASADAHESAEAVGTADASTDVPGGPELDPGETGRIRAGVEDAGRAGQSAPEVDHLDTTSETDPIEAKFEANRAALPNVREKGTRVAWMDDAFNPPRRKTGTVQSVQSKDQGTIGVLVDGGRDGNGYDVTIGAAAVDLEANVPETDGPKKKPRGGSPKTTADFGGAPSISEASTNSGLSKYRQAYRDAGLDPDDANLMPAAKKLDTFKKLMGDQFGIQVQRGEGRKRGTANDAVESALDGYRNMQFMSHALGLPLKALGLRDTLSVSFDAKPRTYLGLYNLQTRTIHMPGRSNSFAHEWAHALDHYLSGVVTPANVDKLLSRVTRADGIDPSDSLSAAYVNLIHKLFFDEASLAAQMLRLEKEASATVQNGKNAGQPTVAAQRAQKSLERTAQGATRVKVDPSAYRQNSTDAAPERADYYASVHELLARAFEAYVAFKVEAVGGTTEFISKGEAAYLNDADAALASLYPKKGERLQIFRAFDEVMGQLATQSVLADGPAADAPADVDVLDPARIAKLALTDNSESLGAALKTEFARVRNMTKALFTNPQSALGQTTSALAINAGVAKQTGESNKGYMFRAANRAAHIGRSIALSMRGATKALVREQPDAAQPFLKFLLDRVMTDHGTGRNIEQTFEEARELRTNQEGAKITRLLKAHGLENWTTGRLKQADNDTIRDLLLGKDVPGAAANLRKVATELRNIMSAAYERAKDAGIEMGYVEDTGYIPRVLLHARIQARPGDFVKDATQMYEVVFDQTTADMDPDDVVALAYEVSRRVDPMEHPTDGPFKAQITRLSDAIKALEAAPTDAAAQQEVQDAVSDLLDTIRADFAETSAHAWKERVIGGDSWSFDSLGPATNFTKGRTFSKEADDILAEWYDTDVLTGTLNYVHGVEARAQYHSRFGKPGGTDRVDLLLRRRDVAARVKQNPRKYDTKSPEGRLRIIQDLADVSRDNVKEMALNEAVKAGADGDAVGQVRANIEEITGRGSNNGIKHMDRLSAALFALGYIALLPRAAWSSLVEPTTILMRTGSVKAAMKTYQRYAMEAVRSAKSTKEMQAIAEAVGLVSTPLHDVVLLNRMSGDHGSVVSGNTLLTRFFRSNFLSQLTNAQRRSVMVGGTLWLRDLAKQYNDPKLHAGDRATIEAEFNELGIGGDKLAPMIDWLADGDGMPSLDDLHTPQGQAYGAAIARFTDQTIQNPRRADKPMGASSSMGRLVYALMSFNYTLFANVHAATAKRSKTHKALAQEAGENTMSVTSAAVEPYLTTAMGFAALFAGQVVVGALRAMLYNADQWEEKEEQDELAEWLGWTAFSRSGILGPSDVLLNAANGLRYERDLTSLMVGATPAWLASNLQNIIKGLPKAELYEGGPGVGLRNSANTNSAEHTALKSTYNLFAVPSSNAGLAALPAPGPIGALSKFTAMQFLSSSTAASMFADTIVGEKGTKTDR